MFENGMWLFTMTGGVLILAAVIVIAQLRQRRLSRSEQATQNQKVRELYSKDSSQDNEP